MNIRQISSVIIILLMAAAIFTLFARQRTDPAAEEVAQLEPQLMDPVSTETDLDSALDGEGGVEPLDLAEITVEEEIIVEEVLEEPVVVAAPPAQCSYPGDGFTPTIRGANPTDFVPFEYPRAKGSGDIAVQPTLPDQETACVVLTYDISASGDVINLQVYDIQPASAAADEYYKKTAVVAARSQSYYPGARNGKAVQIDNNVMEVRFASVN